LLSLEDGVIGGSLPTAIGALSNLEVLDMNFNLLEGPLPTQLYSLTRLTQIDLNDNLLTGPIGTGIGSLADLTFFQVQTNQLTGTLPSELQQLLALGALVSLSRGTFACTACQFVSLAPPCLGFCPFPTGVANFEENSFAGSMPAGGQLTSLTADCLEVSGRPSPPYVACECCTQCF
jgi:hypothetical protein